MSFTQVKRWTEHRLNVEARPKTVYEFYATGHGMFPFDMLRYDSCWPASGEDAAKIEWGHTTDHRGQRSIKMRSYREPTVERWSSFGWAVGVHKLGFGWRSPNDE